MALPAAVGTALARMKAATASGTGWARAVADLLEAAVGTSSTFRDPALRDVAPGPNALVTVQAGDQISPDVLPGGRLGIQKVKVKTERSGRGTLVSWPELSYKVSGDTVTLTLTLHMVPVPGSGDATDPEDPGDTDDGGGV